MKSKMHINILYEDNHLLVVEKPVNVLSQSDSTGDADLLTILKEDLKKRYNKPGNVYLGLVHRLDRPVGGVMVFAKTSKAASRLSDQIRKRDFKKTYLAVVHGIPVPASGLLEHYLVKDSRTNTVRVMEDPDDEAKKAVLEYKILESTDGLGLVKINLHTGRPHQIRVQFSAFGHPLYGDRRYGSSENEPGEQIALRSYCITFVHPTLKEEMTFTSPPPHVCPWHLFGTDNPDLLKNACW